MEELDLTTTPQVEGETIFQESVISIKRVTKVTAGAKILSFRAVVVAGDKNGNVGFGIGKSRDVRSSIQKASLKAKKNLITIPIINGTIPHQVIGKNSSAVVLLRPAREGHGISAVAPIRAIAEFAGIENLVAKVIRRSKNAMNIIYATFDALKKLRTREEINKLRFETVTS